MSQFSVQKISGIIILDKNSRNNIFVEILEEYYGGCFTYFQQMQQKTENAFLANLPSF